MEREEEEERRRKSVGNKLEVEKEVSVQSLREKTLKCDCVNGMEYHGFWVKIVFKVYGDKIKNGSMSGLDWGEFVQGFGGEYIVRMIFI